MGASEWGKPPNALRAKGVEKEEEEDNARKWQDRVSLNCVKKHIFEVVHVSNYYFNLILEQ
jgi:hypothetical protein